MDDQLGKAGIKRTGDVMQPRVRPWGTVLTAPTSAGPVWMKAPGPHTAFEVRLYPLLRKVVPSWTLPPIAVDVSRAWLLLPDGGTTLWASGNDPVSGMLRVLPQYARLQRQLMPHVSRLLQTGVADMRAPIMPQRFDEALAAVTRRSADSATIRRIAARRDVVADWCSQLAASPIPASLDHNDLHTKNVFLDGDRARFYDWGDSVVAHPFASMIVVLKDMTALLGYDPGDPIMLRLRDAYLEAFSDLAPHKELVAELELACRVGMIARTLVWDQALSTAGGRSDFEDAPLDTLKAVLTGKWS